jgi:outer membrane protein assembly factor BamE (lipoprotein component of BamABCDE complex)
MMRSPLLTLTALACALALAGCQTFSPDGGMSLPAQLAGEHLNKEVLAQRTEDDVSAARAKVDRLLKRPLTADTAGANRAAQQSRPASRL